MTPRERAEKIIERICNECPDCGCEISTLDTPILLQILTEALEQSAVPDEQSLRLKAYEEVIADKCKIIGAMDRALFEVGIVFDFEKTQKVIDEAEGSKKNEVIETFEADIQSQIKKSLASRPPEPQALKERQDKVREALEFIVNREDFSFAECSVAEEIWRKAKEALALLDGGGK